MMTHREQSIPNGSKVYTRPFPFNAQKCVDVKLVTRRSFKEQERWQQQIFPKSLGICFVRDQTAVSAFKCLSP